MIWGLKGQLLFKNSTFYGYGNGYPNGLTNATIPCEGMELQGVFWYTPDPVYNSYTLQADAWSPADATNQSVPPNPSAIKVGVWKCVTTAETYGIIISNTDELATSTPTSEFLYLCNGLGGSVPTMPFVTCPYPLFQSQPNTTTNGVNTWILTVPPNPLSLNIAIAFAWGNGQALSPTFSGSVTTASGLASWITSNWGSYFSSATASGNLITLQSSTLNAFGALVSLVPINYCLNTSALYPAGQINAITAVAAGGSGYAVGDVIALNGGSAGYATVATVSTGAVSTVTLVTPNYSYGYTASTVATTAVTGSGTGCTLTITVHTSAAIPVNGVTVNGGAIQSIPFIMLDNTPTTMNALYNALLPLVPGAVITPASGSGGNKINILTTQGVVALYNNTTLELTAGSGACS
jgi:hypothetical protein